MNIDDRDLNNKNGDYERHLRRRIYSNGESPDRGGYERRLADTRVRKSYADGISDMPAEGNAAGFNSSPRIRDHKASQNDMSESERYRKALEERKMQYAAEHPVEVKRPDMSLNNSAPVNKTPERTSERAYERLHGPAVNKSTPSRREPIPEPVPEREPEDRKKGGAFAIILIIISACIFLFAAYKLFTIWQEYNAGKSDYKGVSSYAVLDPDQGKHDAAVEDVMLQYDIPEIDFDALAAENEDVIGWLYFKEPEISYPIVAGRDNSYYLSHTFSGNVNGSGAIFADMNNASDFTDANTVIYGHNMKNNAMFGAFDEFVKEDYGRENNEFFLYTRTGGIYRFRIYSFMNTRDDSYVYTTEFDSADGYHNFQMSTQNDSMYDFEAEVRSDRPVLALSTCTNTSDTGRYVLLGILDEVICEADPQISVVSFE